LHTAHHPLPMTLATTSRHSRQNLFDYYAHRYPGVLNRALAPSGETAEYFARMRVEWLQIRLRRLGFVPASVLDYGCGVGGAVPFLKEILHPDRIVGVDTAPEMLLQARRDHPAEAIQFENCHHFLAHSEFHLAFCNGVFHHIEPEQRAAALRYIYNSLIPKGILAFWENNPWNLATRYIMGRCEFDSEAVPISHFAARKLLRNSGFQVILTSTYFYFPGWLKWLRSLEPTLARLPLGAQYLVLARKPG
jgi:SAM-dependent methyltransferase